MSDDGLAEVARLRQALYRFCAGALLPPDPGRVDDLRAAARLIDREEVDAFAFAPAWHSVNAELARLPPVEALAAEHVRLFQATPGRALCPPVESFYLGSARHAGAATTARSVEAAYRRHGLRFAPGQAHLADEAAPQLELLAHLCGLEAAAREREHETVAANAVAEQLVFLDGHLARWFPAFAGRVRAAAPEGFYRAVVELADAFVGHDQELAAGLAASGLPA